MLEKTKAAYIIWHQYHKILPKTERYSLGQKIDSLFVEVMEAIAVASFLSREEKQPYVRLAIKKSDVLKILLMILWEIGSLDTKKYIGLSSPLDEIGRMLGGWNGQLSKQSSPEFKLKNSPQQGGEK